VEKKGEQIHERGERGAIRHRGTRRVAKIAKGREKWTLKKVLGKERNKCQLLEVFSLRQELGEKTQSSGGRSKFFEKNAVAKKPKLDR